MLEIVEQRQEQQDLPAEEAGMVRDARLHARHAAQVVTNMLDFTKLRAGELVLPTDVPFAVQALCEECCTLVSHLVSSKPVALRVDCGELPPGLWLAGAPFHLTQVLVNLLTNAIKSTSKGSVTLAARLYGPTIGSRALAAAAAAGVEACVRFTVTDTGKGVPAELRRRIFEPFASGSDVSSSTGGASLSGTTSPTPTVQRGTGLGLPLCTGLVRLMGGSLELDSPPAGGAAFSFCATLGRVDAAAAAARGASPVAERPPHLVSPSKVSPKTSSSATSSAGPSPVARTYSALRVLVADDSTINRKLLVRRLSIELPGAQVAQAVTGEEALAMLVPADGGAAPFDVAFLDEHYGVDGGLRGTDVTRLAREHERRRVGAEAVARRLVLVGTTGDASAPGHDALARESGQDIVLGKPMPERLPAELLALLG